MVNIMMMMMMMMMIGPKQKNMIIWSECWSYWRIFYVKKSTFDPEKKKG